MSVLCLIMMGWSASAQADRHDVRAGNRKFAKGDFKSADIFYRKGLNADSTSFASAYNLANVLYRQENMDEAAKQLDGKEQAALDAGYGADYYYNKGDVALAKKDYQQAVDAFRKSLLIRPDDMDAKSNYAYAKKMLENQEQNGGGGGGGQDQNQDQQNQDQNGGGDQNQDQNQDKDQQNQDQGQGQQDQPQQAGASEQKISPQQAQQMLKAIQAKEKETQEKVDKEKAAQEKTRQREKNW